MGRGTYTVTTIRRAEHCKDCNHPDHPWSTINRQGMTPFVESGKFEHDKGPDILLNNRLHYFTVELSCGHLATWAWSENRTPKVGATFPCHVCEGAAVKPQASAP